VADLSITALYTSQTWLWGGFSYAELLATKDSKRVFDITNAALGLARRFNPALPLLRESLVHRHAMIDHLVQSGPHARVVELAAGLSRRGAALTVDPDVHYTEIDLVASKKRDILARSDGGRAVLARPNLTIVDGDVETTPFPPADVVIAEGLLMYLDAEAQRRLFAKVRALGSVRFVFDLVPTPEQPPPGRAGRALESIMKRFTGGRGFTRDTRTRGDILAELRTAGFGNARALVPADIPGLPHPEWRTQTVVFTASPAIPS
jgi:hypothetical protein